MTAVPSPREEAERLLAFCSHPREAYDLLEKQMSVLVMRTQVMLSLCGIVITVTGFSGRAVAETGELARGCMVVGMAAVLGAASVAIGGVHSQRTAVTAARTGADAKMFEAATW